MSPLGLAPAAIHSATAVCEGRAGAAAMCGWIAPPVQRGSCGGITPAELVAVRGRLEAFAEDLFASLPRKDQRARGECDLGGLLLDAGASRWSRWPSG
jgi:hypothetical protein